MRPAASILQLDTTFPRVPGDVGCPETYVEEVEIQVVAGATVGKIVSDRPHLINIAPFVTALQRAQGEIVVTSCGFLSFWQGHLAGQTSKPFVSSALVALSHLSQRYAPGEVWILTFDAARLTRQHLGNYGEYAAGIIGLAPQMHLRQVISQNLTSLDTARVARELAEFVACHQQPQHKHLLLECTNLPPYKAALHKATGLPITDILTEVEARRPGTIRPAFLTPEAAL